MNKEKKRKHHMRRRKKKGPVSPMLLSAYNYKILAIGILCVILGFGGMYIEGQQFGVYSLYVAPLLILAGFIMVAVSVFRTDPKRIPDEEIAKE